MNFYLEAVKNQLKDWRLAAIVLIFTAARVIYGWRWLKSGWGKLGWLSDGQHNTVGRVEAVVNNLAGPEVTSFDPLYINKGFALIADNIFLSMPAVTDFLVVVIEISIGLTMIFGFGIFWFALIAMFMNTQFMASGSFNNFGYIWTNVGMMAFAKYAELIGLSGYLRFRKSGDKFSLSDFRPAISQTSK